MAWSASTSASWLPSMCPLAGSSSRAWAAKARTMASTTMWRSSTSAWAISSSKRLRAGPGPCAASFAQEDRDWRLRGHLLGHAAHEQPDHAAAAVRAHHNQVRTHIPGCLDDALSGRGILHGQLIKGAGRCGGLRDLLLAISAEHT